MSNSLVLDKKKERKLRFISSRLPLTCTDVWLTLTDGSPTSRIGEGMKARTRDGVQT